MKTHIEDAWDLEFDTSVTASISLAFNRVSLSLDGTNWIDVCSMMCKLLKRKAVDSDNPIKTYHQAIIIRKVKKTCQRRPQWAEVRVLSYDEQNAGVIKAKKTTQTQRQNSLPPSNRGKTEHPLSWDMRLESRDNTWATLPYTPFSWVWMAQKVEEEA